MPGCYPVRRRRPSDGWGCCTTGTRDAWTPSAPSAWPSRRPSAHTDADGTEWIYHVSLYGESGAGLDLANPVDREHYEYAVRCKEPGWEELRPVLMLTPRPIRPLLEAWARDGNITDTTGGHDA